LVHNCPNFNGEWNEVYCVRDTIEEKKAVRLVIPAFGKYQAG
jgi:hypothetical protein